MPRPPAAYRTWDLVDSCVFSKENLGLAICCLDIFLFFFFLSKGVDLATKPLVYTVLRWAQVIPIWSHTCWSSQIILNALQYEILSLKSSKQLCVYNVVSTQNIPLRWEGDSDNFHTEGGKWMEAWLVCSKLKVLTVLVASKRTKHKSFALDLSMLTEKEEGAEVGRPNYILDI